MALASAEELWAISKGVTASRLLRTYQALDRVSSIISRVQSGHHVCREVLGEELVDGLGNDLVP